SENVINALRVLISAQSGDLALVAELIKLPSFDTFAAEFDIIPVDEIITITRLFEQQIAEQLSDELLHCYSSLVDDGSINADAVAIRALKGVC
ncbi:MAG TPA: aminopeptidase N, partial [Pseudoalteromonas sp.]|nr:aminopeptidase N [Pseudoalteromonas sp.]